MSQDSYNLIQHDNYVIIELLEQKFTAKIAPDLKTELVLLNSIGTKNIIINLGKTQYCDSSGLSVILVANRICRDNKGILVICEVNDAVYKLIEISQLDSVLNITPSLNEAIDYIFMDELEKGLGDIDEHLN